MKKLFFLFAVSLPLLLIGCAENEQEISPLSPITSYEALEFEKVDADISHPFKLYENLPELTNYKVSWIYNDNGLVINVNTTPNARVNLLFAVIDLIDVDNAMSSAQMVYLGNSAKGTYLIPGLVNRAVGSIRIYANSISPSDRKEPYKESQLFKNIMVQGWSDGTTHVKISSEKFPPGLRNLFVELTAIEGNALVYLGKPVYEDFDFPKSSRQNIIDMRMFGYTKLPIGVNHNLTHQ